MSKRRGKYRIEPVYEYVDGLDDNFEEVIKEEKLIIQGRFSLEFWARCQKAYGVEGLSEVLALFTGGLNPTKVRDMIYHSHMAWVEEVSKHSPNIKPTLLDEAHASSVVEQLEQEDVHAVTEALIDSQLISELVKAGEAIQEELNKEEGGNKGKK